MTWSWRRATRTGQLRLGQHGHLSRCDGWALQNLPPGPCVRISRSQLIAEGLNLIQAMAVNPLAEQPLHCPGIACNQGTLKSLNLRLPASLGQGSSGGSRSHRGGSGELAIQQRADQQEQTHRQHRQHRQTGSGTEISIGSLKDHC